MEDVTLARALADAEIKAGLAGSGPWRPDPFAVRPIGFGGPGPVPCPATAEPFANWGLDHVLETATDDPKPASSTDVDRVIDQLDRRLIGQPDRARLRKAVDRADAPQTGRAGQDAAAGRAIGRGGSLMGLRVP